LYCKSILKGIYITPSENLKGNPTNFQTIEWNGVIFIKSGLYKNGIFKFNLSFPTNYPFEAPNLYFQSAINHTKVIFFFTHVLDFRGR
jgi:ubiquitin-protein ligase